MHLKLSLIQLALSLCAAAAISQSAGLETTLLNRPNQEPSILKNLLRDQGQAARQVQRNGGNSNQPTTLAPPQTISSSSSPASSLATSANSQPVTSVPSSTTLATPTIISTSAASTDNAAEQQTTTTVASKQQQVITSPEHSSNGKRLQPDFQIINPVSYSKCSFKDQTYALGQKWNDDCEQKCECVADESRQVAVSACRPRCPTPIDSQGEGCKWLRSETDACCLELVCSTESKLAPSGPSTTVTNNEQGHVNMTTTEIKLPSTSPAPPTTIQALSTTTPVAATTTTTPAPTTMKQQPTSPKRPATTVPTTTSLPQTRKPIAPTTTASPVPGASRAPKQVPSNLPPQTAPTVRPQSLVASPSTGLVGQSRTMWTEAEDPQARPVTTVAPQADVSESPASEMTSNDQLEVDPNEEDLCIYGNETGYKVGQLWLGPCDQTCRCTFRSEPKVSFKDAIIQETVNLKNGSDQTEIRCSLPPSCRPVAPDCLKPQFTFPIGDVEAERCACPQVSCAQPDASTTTTFHRIIQPVSSSTAPATTAVASATTIKPSSTDGSNNGGRGNNENIEMMGCKSRKQAANILKFGESFNDECHSVCTCYTDGEIRCQPLDCKPPSDIPCLQWVNETSADSCCPQFTCKEPGVAPKSCTLMGKSIPHGEPVPELIQPRDGNKDCEKICICDDGKISCQCPALSETPPEGLSCSPEQAAIRTDIECCPKWSCPPVEEYALREFSVTPINATAVEVVFVLPNFAVGRRGKARLNYTGAPVSDNIDLDTFAGDLQDPPADAQWATRSNIKTNDSVFYHPRIIYYLNNLKPAHKYWFHLVVHFFESEPQLQDPLESPVISIVMPKLDLQEVASSSAPVITSTTTTTVPPTRIIQPISPTRNQPSLVSSTTPPTTTPSTTASDVKTGTKYQQTSTSTTTTTTTPPPTPTKNLEQSSSINLGKEQVEIPKPDVSQSESTSAPCAKSTPSGDSNNVNNKAEYIPQGENALPLMEYVQSQMNALHLLIALSVMTILFIIVSYLYLKKSVHVVAPITSQSAYDNPTFTKLVSYYANQPHVLLVDENSQNYDNDVILSKQKNMEVDKSSPLHNNNNGNHRHHMNHHHHHNLQMNCNNNHHNDGRLI